MKLEVFIKKPFSNFLVSVHPGLAVNSDDNSKHDYILFNSVIIIKKICSVILSHDLEFYRILLRLVSILALLFNCRLSW